MKPNIFEIATKELNQDAFITWLLQFADANCIKYDEYINKCGIEFVTELIKKQIPELWDLDISLSLGADIGTQFGNSYGVMFSIAKRGIILIY